MKKLSLLAALAVSASLLGASASAATHHIVTPDIIKRGDATVKPHQLRVGDRIYLGLERLFWVNVINTEPVRNLNVAYKIAPRSSDSNPDGSYGTCLVESGRVTVTKVIGRYVELSYEGNPRREYPGGTTCPSGIEFFALNDPKLVLDQYTLRDVAKRLLR